MRIAILTSGILPIPAVQGGAVENLVDFYLEYNKHYHIHDITVYSVWNEKVKSHPALSASVNHYQYIDTSSIWARIKRFIYSVFHKNEYYNYFIEYFFEEAYKDIRKKQYDCIILENRPGYAYKLVKRGYNNIVLHLHNDLLNKETPYHQDVFNSLSLILTVSDYIKNRVSTIEPSNKIHTIHNGIDLSRFAKKENSPINREKLGLTNHDFVMVYSGRINKDKGVEELIDAMLLLKNINSIKLLIIGSTFFGNAANEDDFVRSLKEKSQPVKHRIIFTGFVPYHQMPDYIQLADIAIIPSIWDDPFPTTILEAQAMGLPIITTNRGGITEEVGKENALLVSTGAEFSLRLADAIQLLYNDPQKRNKMSKESLQHSKYYDKNRFAKDFFNTLKDIKP